MTFRHPCISVLLACVRDRDWSVAPAELTTALDAGLDLDAFAAAATWHRVQGYAWLSLRAAGRDEAAAGPLERQYQLAVGNHLRILGDLALVDDALAAAGVPFAVLKGPALAALSYPRPDLRSYQDLDVIVSPGRFAQCVSALEDAGFRVLDANWSLLTTILGGEIHLAAPSGTIVDLHWSLLNDHTLRQVFSVATDTLLDNAVERTIGGRATPVLEPTDALGHVALHAAISGADRLGWLKDVEQTMSAFDVDPGVFVQRMREWRASTAVGTVLARTRHLLGDAIPSEILADLMPSRAWRQTAAVADRVSRLPDGDEGGSLARMVARAARTDAGSSFRELARRGAAWVWHGGPFWRPKPSWNPADPTSVAHPAGDRSTYLAAVAAQR